MYQKHHTFYKYTCMPLFYMRHAVLYGDTYFLFLYGVAPTYNSRLQLGPNHALNLSAKQLHLLTAPSKVSFTHAVKSFVITRRSILSQTSNRGATLMCEHSWVKASLIQTGITGEHIKKIQLISGVLKWRPSRTNPCAVALWVIMLQPRAQNYTLSSAFLTSSHCWGRGGCWGESRSTFFCTMPQHRCVRKHSSSILKQTKGENMK